jgi:hypothetical protein
MTWDLVVLPESSDDKLAEDAHLVSNSIFEKYALARFVLPLEKVPSKQSADFRVCVAVMQTCHVGAADRTLGHQEGIGLRIQVISIVHTRQSRSHIRT